MNKKDRDALKAYADRVAWIADNAESGGYETDKQRKEAIERSKKDIAFMVKRYFSHIADCESAKFQIDFAKKVKRKKTFKGFAEWPRGHAKSVWLTIFIPFWLKINGQTNYCLEISNSFEASADLLDDLRAELEANPAILQDFGEQKTAVKKWERGYFICKDGWVGRALGIGQKVRGLRIGKHRPDLIIIDDLETETINNNPVTQNKYVSWIERSLIPTMTGNNRRLLYSNNRWAKRMIQTILQKRHPAWTVQHIKAYNPVTLEAIAWPEKYNKEFWQAQVTELGTIACAAEYNQEPYVEGKLFTENYFKWEFLPQLRTFNNIIAYWDVAYSEKETADFNAVKVWGQKGDNFYLIKAFVRQCRPDSVFNWMYLYNSLMTDKGITIPFFYEAQFWNESLALIYKECKKQWKGSDINLIQDNSNKIKKFNRMLSRLLPLYQQGRIIYNKTEQSSNDMLVGNEQLKALEPGYKTHDDSPDADEGALKILMTTFRSTDDDDEMQYGNQYRSTKY